MKQSTINIIQSRIDTIDHRLKEGVYGAWSDELEAIRETLKWVLTLE